MKKLLAAGIALGIVAGGVYAQREPILRAIGSNLVSADPLMRADAIAVLSGDTPERILEGIDLFRRGFAPRVLLTIQHGARRRQERIRALGVEAPTRLEVNRQIALQQGVPAEAIEVLPTVRSTRHEAEAILDYLRERGMRSVIVVTSNYHSTRARRIFRSLNRAPPGEGAVKVVVRPSRYGEFDPGAWWHSREQTKIVFYEYVKLLNHFTVGF
ncbi:MAG: YdcF family protein [Nitrospinota bacterium]